MHSINFLNIPVIHHLSRAETDSKQFLVENLSSSSSSEPFGSANTDLRGYKKSKSDLACFTDGETISYGFHTADSSAHDYRVTDYETNANPNQKYVLSNLVIYEFC